MQTALEALPGVRSVAFTRTALLSGSDEHDRHLHARARPADKDAKDIYIMSVSPKFFETMEIPMLLGRDFDEHDVANPDGLGRSSTRRRRKKYFPNENPIGQRVGQSPEESGKTEIVGVIRDTKYNSVRDARAADDLHVDPAGNAGR